MILVQHNSFLSWLPKTKITSKGSIVLPKQKNNLPLLDVEDDLEAEEAHGLTERELTDLGLMTKCRAYCAEEGLNFDSLLS